jgi:predicted nucleic acid-binding protein
MTKTLIDLDDDSLERARQILRVYTKKDTVNGALREVRRLAAVRQLLAAAGDEGPKPDTGLVLVDASVLAQGAEPAVITRLLPLLAGDRLATCAAVEHEVAELGEAVDNVVLAALRQVGARWLATEDANLRRAAEVQAELTSQGERRLPWHRLVIAAVAERHEVKLLHAASDFDLIATVTGQPMELVAVAGTLERPGVFRASPQEISNLCDET